MIDLPRPVRRKAERAGAHAWLAGLDELVHGLEHDWQISAGAVFPDATEALVLAVTCADDTPAVLKLHIPRPGEQARREIAVLELAGGDGCVALLGSDLDRLAMLLPRLGPSMHELGLPIAQRHAILADLARAVWRPVPDRTLTGGVELTTGAAKADGLGAFIAQLWAELDHPIPERTVQHALDCADRRRLAYDPDRVVLNHGDVHEWNALRTDDGFALVDPDGLLAEPEYDLGVIMREDPVELIMGDPMDRARWLARRTGCDPVAIWEWGVVERVSTGLLATSIDLQPVGGQMLHAANLIAADS